MSKAARSKKKRNIAGEYPRQKYGSKRFTALSRKHANFAPAQVIHRVSKGLPFGELEHLRSEIDEPLESMARRLAISRSTLQRRKAERRLSPQESDRVMRFFRLFRQAVDLFGGAAKARAWLKHPQYGLGGAVPLEYGETEIGAREVENLLGRMKYGVYS
jgi:putative toxin-antitoxin system antitoxin component (TIGR02293 family)